MTRQPVEGRAERAQFFDDRPIAVEPDEEESAPMARPRGLEISRYGRAVSSVFDLLGTTENDLTAALGFALARSPCLLAALTGIPVHDAAGSLIRLETADEEGRTDLEIETPSALLVVEAKRGWTLPFDAQLRRYAGRVSAFGGGRLLTLSDCSPEWAALKLPPRIADVVVEHLPWHRVQADLDQLRRDAKGQERVWLEQLQIYLKGAIRVREPADSWVYSVVISSTKPGGGGDETFFDFIDKHGVYFHPFGSRGGRWPTTPPNFMAFRWDGKVQRIHRVLAHEVIPSLQIRWPAIPVTPETDRPHVVYRLGPRLRFDPIPNGRKIYPSMRVWVLLDQLLSCDSLVEARQRSVNLDAGQAPADDQGDPLIPGDSRAG